MFLSKPLSQHSDNKATSPEVTDRSVHCQEFYRMLYPEHGVSNNYYSYDRFSIPDATDGPTAVGQNVLKWFYIQNCLENGSTCELEIEGMLGVQPLFTPI